MEMYRGKLLDLEDRAGGYRRFMDVVNEDMQGLVWQRRMQGEKVRCVQMKYK